MTEQEIVKKCLSEIIQKNGYDTTQVLTQRGYDQISREIQAKTTILISISTLKRLANGDFNRLPQTATLNAISHYLGYATWQEYKITVKKTAFANGRPGMGKLHKVPGLGWANARKLGLPLVIILLTGLLITFLLSGSSVGTMETHYEKATFSAQKTTANDMPNTVVFSYNIDGVVADSFFIQQSWDKNRRVRVQPGQYTLTDIYYEPGYHTAKLIANDSIIRTVDVSIPTDRWFLYAKGLEPGSLPKYIRPITPFSKNGLLTIDSDHLQAAEVDPKVEQNYFYTFFPGRQEVSSDNFCLRTRLRMRQICPTLCPKIMVEVFCQRNFTFFKSTSKGCASEGMLEFGESLISGKNHDLSALAYDLTQWIEVEIMVKDKVATIRFNQEPVYSGAYEKSSGLITGLGFISNGLCEIDYVELKGLDGKVVYADDFSDPDPDPGT